MEKHSELLIRSALHDMANILAGIQGILELADPQRPLGVRDKDRLDAVVEEGMATLVRARHLAMGTLPEALMQEGVDWRAQLAEELRPMGILFKCQFAIVYEGGPAPDLWLGTLLRTYVRAVARQVLPYVHTGLLDIRCAIEDGCWRVRLAPATFVPDTLVAVPEDRPGDISGRWAVHLRQTLKADVSCEDGVLTLRIPRT